MSKKKNRFLLVVCDLFTKYTLIFPLKAATVAAAKDVMRDRVFLVFGVPEYLVADNGVQYVSRRFRALLESHGMSLQLTPRYHPSTNPTERSNRVIKTLVTAFLKDNQRDWDEKIPEFQFAINSVMHEVTGFTPAFMTFGREIVLHGRAENEQADPTAVDRDGFAQSLKSLRHACRVVSGRLKNAYASSAARYNLRRRFVPYEVDQVVWKRNYVLSNAGDYFSAKLAPKFVKCIVTCRSVCRTIAINCRICVTRIWVCGMCPF